MGGAAQLVPSLRRTLPPPPPAHLFLPSSLYDTPQERMFFQKDPFFLPQVKTQTSLIRSEPLSTIFTTQQFQSDSFSSEEPCVETSSDGVELAQVQTPLGEAQLDKSGSNSDLVKNTLEEEIHAELLTQNLVFESMELEEFDEPEIGSQPSRQCPSAYNKLMKSFSRIGNVDEVLRLLSEIRDSGCEPNVLCYNTVINAFVISGRAKDAQHMFDEMLMSEVVPNVSTFNILVKLYCLFSKQFDLAYMVMAKMKEFGFRPDLKTYSTVITGLCKVGQLEEAWGVLDLMMEEKCAPTVGTYTPIVHGYCLQGKIEEAKELMATMESVGCAPNTVTYNILIRALCEVGRFDEVEKILEESQTKGWIPNSITYNTYMHGLYKMSMSKQALEKLEIMIHKGLKPTYVTIGILINCLFRDSNFLEAQTLLQKSQFWNCGVGVICYNTLMSRLSEISRWWLVLKLLTDMFKKGIDPNTRTLNIVIHSLCHAGKSDFAKVLITNRGFVRNTVTYNTLLHWFFKEGRFNEARVLVSDMAIDKISPDEITFGIMVDGLCREGKFAEATGCFLESLASGVAGHRMPIFVNRLVKNRRLLEMLQLFKGMQERGFTVDASMFDLTIRAFCRHGFCVSTDMNKQCLVLDKLLEVIYQFDKCKQGF